MTEVHTVTSIPRLTIRSLRVRAVRVPLPEPHQTVSGTITDSPLVLTDLLTEEGVEGHSLVFCYTMSALKPVAVLVQALGPIIEHRLAVPLEIEQLLAQRFRLLGPQGLTGIAMAAVDMAVWDAVARAHELPLALLLGAGLRPVPAYGADGYDGPDRSARTAAAWVERGFRGVKAKIGHDDVHQDLAVVRAIRRSVGDGVEIMVDYNQSLTPADAIERGRWLEQEDLTWIEEPTRADDFAGLARVARDLRTPIQAGENWWGPYDVRKAIEAESSDYLMLDVMKVGGVTGWLRAAALAEAHGIRVSNHLFPEISAQLLCATPTAHRLEYADWFNPILEQPLRIQDGKATPSDRPGSGIEWDRAAVARYEVQ